MMTPREMTKYPTTIVTNTATYSNASTIGIWTPKTVQTKPISRNKATPPIAPISDQPRLCRVVRGAPR